MMPFNEKTPYFSCQGDTKCQVYYWYLTLDDVVCSLSYSHLQARNDIICLRKMLYIKAIAICNIVFVQFTYFKVDMYM